MITGRNIICFASGWDYHPTSKHHVMRRLARHNDVIWVNWHVSRRPQIRLDDIRAICGKLWQINRGAQRVADGITVLTPHQIPMPHSRLARRANAISVKRAVGKVLSRLPRRPVQIWSFAPDTGDLVGLFDEERVVYYCVDAFGEFPGYDRELIALRERELMDKSDVVITTSKPLFEARQDRHPQVHLMQHGVDHERLSRAVEDELTSPPELANLPRPIIGYVGVIGEWVDLELVAGLARRHPQASFVLIGPKFVARGPCLDRPNVHWLGERDHAHLAAYLRCFDVGLIPFKHVPLTHNANPIKLYEYLAAGVPVVSTALPAVEPLDRSVWIADDVDGQAACCAEALHCNQPADRRERSHLMRAQSWDARLEELDRIVSAAPGRPISAVHMADTSAASIALNPSV